VSQRIVAGRFELGREAGAGGMGTVYCARDLTDGALVAVKLLKGRDVRERKRFAQEAAILAELSHPAIVRYLAHGVTDADEHYIVMEWLEGEDLGVRIARHPLTVGESIFAIRRAAEALSCAHARGIVHRDVKPENLFLPDGQIGRLKILDFGIARVSAGGRRLTLTGSVVGTPGYLAPELVRGDREVSASADVFSLGCVFYLCLTGRPAFEAEDGSGLLAKILLQDAPRVRDLAPHLPEEVGDLVARMLRKDPSARLADAETVLRELDALGEAKDAGGRRRKETRRPALTATEQRIACVVLAGASAATARRARGATVRIGLDPHALVDELGLDPETASALKALEGELARAFGALTHALPDGSMIVTLPEGGKSTDQAARAARCALAVRAAFPDLPLCVSTGSARFSTSAVVGEVIDSGMRLLRATPPGSVRLDDMTAGLLDARFEIHGDGTALYLHGERDVFEAARPLMGKVTELVGRGREISMLTNYFTATACESIASAVLVTGPAGAGKSRLRHELVEWVRRRQQRVEVLFGAGDSLGAGSPFAMLGRALRRLAGIQEAEPLDEKRRKLSVRVGRELPLRSIARVTAFLGEVASVPFSDEGNDALRAARQSPQLMGDGMRRAFEDWLAAECAVQPVLIVLEDLHWGDRGTVSFIDAALRNLRERPLMVVALARPDVTEVFPDMWAERELQTIRLAPLPRRAAAKLARGALPAAVSDAVVEQIIDRAGGNAFYLEELIRAAADGRCESLPDSVIGMVQARLDAEGAEARRVLRAASVFGERFSRPGVAALLGGEAEAAKASEWIDHLCARELLARIPSPEGAGGTGDELVFAHALVREAAYAMLTDEDRALGHRLAGDWLEQSGSGDAMALGEHFRRGDEPARSIRWYRRAAEQALKANDLGAAVERAELGMACGARGEAASALRLVQSEAHVWRGEIGLAEERALEGAAALAPGSAGWFRAQGLAIIAAARQGKLDEVEARVLEVSRAVPEMGAGARSADVVCLSWGANYLIFGGRSTAADRIMGIIAELAGDLSELDLQAVALVHQVRSVRASVSGDLGACLKGLETALSAFEQAGDLRNACTVRGNMGRVYCELGDYDRAEVALRSALAAADRMGLHDLSAAILHNLGRVLGLRGNLDEAQALEHKAIHRFQRQGELRLEGVARTYLAGILSAAGDFVSAEREALVAIEALKSWPALRVAAVASLARALLGQGAIERAAATADEGLAALGALSGIEEAEAALRLVHAECLVARGEEEKARAAILAARDWLLGRAARIGEPGWRQRFLEEVPSNARILALADG